MMKANGDRALILVEDNPRDREYLSAALAEFTLHVAERGDQALEMVRAFPHAHLVSDLQLPGMTGIDLAKAVWVDKPTARIVFWSQYNDEIYLRALSRIIPAQALYGYVLKSNHSQLLLRALHSVFVEDQCWIDPQIRPVQARNQSPQGSISDAEYEVLVDIALGLTDNLIAKRRFLSRRGAQSRLKSLYAKLGVDRTTLEDGINPRSRAVAIALKRGLINPYELEKAEEALSEWRVKESSR